MGQIQLQGVTKDFGSVNVIRPLDLEIDDGEFVVFVGPSGCGKSTLLRLIAGLEDTTAEQVSKRHAGIITNALDRFTFVFDGYT